MFKSFFGDKNFYKKVLSLALPIMLQNGITNLVNMLDNLMVGSLADAASSTGVTIANQLFFVFNLCIFGAISGAGIFGAQFYGKGDNDGLRYAFRFKLITAVIISVVGTGLFIFAGEPLIKIYMQGEIGQVNPLTAIAEGKDYLMIMLIGIVPFALSQCYCGTLRECDRAKMPMFAATVAVLVNLILNYILIYGKFGAPELGVRGAAIATVVSRFVELFILLISIHKNSLPFMKGVYRSIHIPRPLAKAILLKTLPLMANEVVWASGMSVVNACYSLKGTDVVPAINILQTFFNLFSVAFLAVGVSIGILLGQRLGETTDKKVMLDYCKKLITTSVLVNVVMGTLFFICSYFIPYAYNYPQNIRDTATSLMQICAIMMPFEAFSHGTYFTLRSGGKTLVTFLFDSGYVWAVDVTAAFALVKFTSLDIITIYLIIQIVNALRCFMGYIFVKKGSWITRLEA